MERDDIYKTIYDNTRLKVRDDSIVKYWTEYITNHYLFRINKYRENYKTSFENLKDCFNNLVEVFKSYDNPDFLSGILKFYMRNLLFSSNLGDQELERKKEKPYCIDECGRVLISFFSKFQMSEEKDLVFYSIICLFRIHFRLKTYRNSKTLVEWTEKTNLNLDYLPKAEVTTFYYYSGRLSIYELKLIDAQRILTNAFNICKNNQFTNKRLILEYLIPLNLFIGVLPTEEFISTYKLNEYSDLIQSYKNGNLLMFEKSLDTLEDRLITLGTFLIVGKLKAYILRNLIRNIYQSYGDELFVNPNSPPVIKIEVIYNVLKNVIKYTEMDIEELELYILGVLYKGLISGYVHSANKVIVFARKAAFPKMSEAFKSNYNKII